MEDFTADLQNLKLSFSELNSSTMELLNDLSALDNSNVDQGRVGLSNESFLDHQLPFFHKTFNTDNIQSSFRPDGPCYDPFAHHFFPSAGGPSQDCKKAEVMSGTDHLVDSSPAISGTGLAGDKKTTRNHSFCGKKRKRNNDKEVEKPREVIHVRARRGQATDSHSLAERLRRERINEKLRCLQDLVPGCYKTMGMAVMLDVIINYVRSLQNQIEFLSMKLSAASLFYDFNSSDMDATDTMQGTNGYEAQVMESIIGEWNGGFPCLPSTWPF